MNCTLFGLDAAYVWSAFGMCLVLMAAEVIRLRWRCRRARSVILGTVRDPLWPGQASSGRDGHTEPGDPP